MVPGGKEICEKQLFNLIDRLEKTEINETEIEQFLPVIYKKLEWLSREELIKHFVSVEFNRFLSYYENAPDLNAVPHKEGLSRGRDQREPRGSGSYSRFYINLGQKNGIDAIGIIGLINKNSKGRRIEIGKIDILRKFSFFEVDSRSTQEILNAFNNTDFKGIPVTVQLSQPDIKEKQHFEDRSQKKKKKNRDRGRDGGRRY